MALALLLGLFLFLQLPAVQDRIGQWAAGKIGSELGTSVTIRRASFSLFNKFDLERLLLLDKHKDTLLYSNRVSLRITDWFFLRSRNKINYLGLEGTRLHLERTDSTWNYAFIQRYLDSLPASKDKHKKPVRYGLGTIDIRNFDYVCNDKWIGEKMILSLDGMILDTRKLDLEKKKIDIESIVLESPRFSIREFDGKRPDSLRPKKTVHRPEDGFIMNPAGITLSIDSVTVRNGSFVSDLDYGPPVSYFDGYHIKFTKIEGKVRKLKLNGDTVKCQLTVSAKERSGLLVKKLNASMKVTPRFWELSKLDVETNKSRFGDYFTMYYDDFFDDFKSYIDNVRMTGRVRNSNVHSDDIAFFAPELKLWKRPIQLSGNFFGTVADFKVKNLSAHSNGTTHLAGDFSMKGIPDVWNAKIDVANASIVTTEKDLKAMVPILDSVRMLDKLGTMRYNGGFNGTLLDFRAKGIMGTSIGAFATDIYMKVPKTGTPTYYGTTASERFDLGRLTGNPQLGTVGFVGKVKGDGFSLDKANANLEGFFPRFGFNGYEYANVKVNGILAKGYFKGDLKVDDPNIDFTSTLDIDLAGTSPVVKVLGDVVKCNFQKLHLTQDDVELSGLLDLNFSGSNIDDFIGSAKLINADLLHEKNKLSFDSLTIVTENRDGVKSLAAASNEFTFKVKGSKYKLLELPNLLQAYLSKYYPSYFAMPANLDMDQDFSMTLITKDFDSYARILNKDFGGLGYASLSATVRPKKGVAFEADIPKLSYRNYVFSGISLGLTGRMDSLLGLVEVADVQVNDSLHFPNNVLRFTAGNDWSSVNLRSKSDNTLNEAEVNAEILTFNDGAKFVFKPSAFVLNNKKWELEREGSVTLKKGLVDAGNIKFTQGFQEIKVESAPDFETGNSNNLRLTLRDVVLGDIASLFVRTPKLEGLANGEVKLNDFYGAFRAEANFRAEQFRLDKDSLGTVQFNAGYELKTGIVDFKAVSNNKNYHFNSFGTYDTRDKAGSPLFVQNDITDTKISFLERFIGDVVSDISGNGIGKIAVKGKPDSLKLLGTVKVVNLGFKVNFTQVRYVADTASIRFVPDGIEFPSVVIKDRFKNKAVVKGKIFEDGFSRFAFDMSVVSSKILMLDTKAKDNKQFYGKAIAKGAFTLKGPLEKMEMKLTAVANDSSSITIVNTVNKESTDADYIVFKKYGTEMEEVKQESGYGLRADLDLTANEYLKINVIMDEVSGDVIKSTGNGRLLIKVGSKDPLSMTGRYEIANGSYDFSFQSFIRKPFEMQPGAGNYIEWNGDPYNADLHIDARYVTERVNLGDLVSYQQQSSVNSGASKSYRGTVYVIASLRDKLSRPAISFALDFPQGSPIKSDAVFNEFLARIASDQSEMLSQATSLIVFGTFAPYGQGVLSSNTVGSSFNNLGVNSISRLFTKQINKAVSNLLFKLTRDRTLRFDLGSSVYSSSSIIDQSSGLNATSSNRLDRTNINFKVGKSFFNENVIVTLGGDLDFNLSATSTIANGNFQWLPDVNIELILSQDKRLRSIVFSKNSLDISGSTLGRRNRQGVSISYKKDFDSFWVFRKKTPLVPYKLPTDTVLPEPDLD